MPPKALTVRSKLDARECLDLSDNQAIATCAESFRLYEFHSTPGRNNRNQSNPVATQQ
ncbi:MAG: hypothetical protein KDF59_01400 [Nitrosomonas sp.]|nr:hypothetical protein [Nitrosomonas sp.]